MSSLLEAIAGLTLFDHTYDISEGGDLVCLCMQFRFRTATLAPPFLSINFKSDESLSFWLRRKSHNSSALTCNIQLLRSLKFHWP